MKNASASAKKFSALLKKIGPVDTPAFPGGNDPVAALVMSMLMWEATTDKALAAYVRLMENVVDHNDLRVCLPHETIEMIGPRYPRALDRCQRLRAVLRNNYLREHAVKLTRLAETGRREAKKYIESLEGIVPYAVARVLLLCFDAHVIPVDDQLRTQLIDAEVADASVEVPELSNWLASQVKPADALAVHFSLQKWIDDIVDGRKLPTRKPPSRRLAGKSRVRSGAKAAAS